MKPIICYRVDLRELEEGASFTSSGDHIDRLNAKLKQAESLLREVSQEKAQLRANSLYAFFDRPWSMKYFIGKRGFLYEIEASESDVRHIADMMLVNRIGEEPNQNLAAKLVEQYWAGDRGDGERTEILLTQATVRKRLYRPADKLMLKQQLYGTKKT